MKRSNSGFADFTLYLYNCIRQCRFAWIHHSSDEHNYSITKCLPVGCPAENRPSATMACREKWLLMGLFLFFNLISRLLVRASIFNAFKILPQTVPFFQPEGRPGSSDVSPPLSGISGLSFDSIFLSALLLFCLVLLLILSSPCLLSRNFFKLFFLLGIGFFVLPLFYVGFFSGSEMISWSLVSFPCYLNLWHWY